MRQHRRSLHRTSVRYGDHPSQLLDVWRRKDLPVEPAPVMIFVPGGAWVHGSRHAAGLRADVAPGRAGLGVPVGRLPGVAAPSLAAAHHRCQDRDRVGARQRRPVRRRPQFRCDGGLFGRRPPGGAGRSDRQRPRDAGRPAGGLGHLGRRRRRHLRPLRLGGPLHRRARPVRRLPRARRGQAQDRPRIPEIFRKASPIARVHRRRAAVPGHPRHRRHRHPGRSRPAASSSGCARCRARWSATSSCRAPATGST